MQISQHTAICSPYWEVDQEYWLPFNISFSALSEEARLIFAHLQSIMPHDISVYARGSVIESALPFARSDLDLFFVLPENGLLPPLSHADIITRRELDVKVIRKNTLQSDKALYSLLAHRSIHVCGPVLNLAPVKADLDFAWRHWLKYCPAGLPAEITCNHRYSVILMKQLIRSFGVLMFLEQNRFTRDIGECIQYAARIYHSLPNLLNDIRINIEKSSENVFSIRGVKNHLFDAFDGIYSAFATAEKDIDIKG